jgi:hypothetical protein
LFIIHCVRVWNSQKMWRNICALLPHIYIYIYTLMTLESYECACVCVSNAYRHIYICIQLAWYRALTSHPVVYLWCLFTKRVIWWNLAGGPWRSLILRLNFDYSYVLCFSPGFAYVYTHKEHHRHHHHHYRTRVRTT